MCSLDTVVTGCSLDTVVTGERGAISETEYQQQKQKVLEEFLKK